MTVDMSDSLQDLTDSQKTLLLKLRDDLGQAHLFEGNPKTLASLAKQLEQLDEAYTDGGLEGYIQNARRLLENSAKGVNPLEGWKPSVPKGECLELGTDEYKETEKEGLCELGNTGFVLVAGGLGERLGYGGIKIGLPTEMYTETCYIQYYIEYILAVQHKYGNGKKLPLCIMTSGDTNEPTIALLEKNDYYGLQKSQVTIVQQGLGVPSLVDNDAKFVLSEDKTKIETKPHGHGDIHELLYKHQVAKKWKDQGIKYLVLFQDTNGLAFHVLPLMLGVSKKLGLLMNSLAVPRKAKQAIGGIAKLTKEETGETRTINVEYNQLDPLLRSTGYKDGDMNDETGFSPFPGNINQLLFRLDAYSATLERTKGLMPEFVNPKYADETKTVFKKPTRLECMMQDFPHCLSGDETKQVGFTSTDADLCFSPVKNATSDGVKLQEEETQPGTAACGEADQLGAPRKMLKAIGVHVEDAEEATYLGIKVVPGPAIVFKPDFVCCPGEYSVKFPSPDKVKISARSTLIVSGSDVTIEQLDLDGALVIDGADGKELVVNYVEPIKNAGWVRVPVSESDDEVIQMRGYRIDRKDTKTVHA